MLFNPAYTTALWLAQTRLLLEAQTVIAIRLMGMAGLWPVQPQEMSRMAAEKGPAFVQAALSAHRAALSGQQPDKVLTAAMAPLTRKARANRKRLTRRKSR